MNTGRGEGGKSVMKMETVANPSRNDGSLERFPLLQMRLLRCQAAQRLPEVTQRVEAGLDQSLVNISSFLPSSIHWVHEKGYVGTWRTELTQFWFSRSFRSEGVDR